MASSTSEGIADPSLAHWIGSIILLCLATSARWRNTARGDVCFTIFVKGQMIIRKEFMGDHRRWIDFLMNENLELRQLVIPPGARAADDRRFGTRSPSRTVRGCWSSCCLDFRHSDCCAVETTCQHGCHRPGGGGEQRRTLPSSLKVTLLRTRLCGVFEQGPPPFTRTSVGETGRSIDPPRIRAVARPP